MSLSDILGGALCGQLSPMQFPTISQNPYMLNNLQQWYPICIHPNCPICAEKLKEQMAEVEAQERIKTQKKVKYENRCKEYMKKFRGNQQKEVV